MYLRTTLLLGIAEEPDSSRRKTQRQHRTRVVVSETGDCAEVDQEKLRQLRSLGLPTAFVSAQVLQLLALRNDQCAGVLLRAIALNDSTGCTIIVCCMAASMVGFSGDLSSPVYWTPQDNNFRCKNEHARELSRDLALASRVPVAISSCRK